MNNPAHILIIDDEPHLLHAVARTLKSGGYSVHEALGGEQGLRLAREHKPDVILLDVVMPDLSGLEVCRRLKADAELSDILVVLLSGSVVDSESKALALEAGADGYITRTVTPRELLAHVQALVRLKRTQDALRKSEQRCRTVVEQVSDGILVVDPYGVVLFANPAAQRMFERSAQELMGSAFGFPLADGHVAEVDLVSAGKVAEMRVAATEWEGRQAFLISLHDITERKQMERQLRQTLAQREWLVRDTYHRVKNNLMVIESLLNLQAAAIQDPAVREQFRISQNRVKSMLLIHEKLHQSKDLTSVNFSAYIHKLAIDLFRAYKTTDAAIRLELDIEDISLSADVATSCGLIINELVSNALKHAFKGRSEGKLRIALHRHADRYMLTVSDDGVGLPADLDLFQTNSLGLQIVMMKVNDLGGTLEVERQPGATFKLIFGQPQ